MLPLKRRIRQAGWAIASKGEGGRPPECRRIAAYVPLLDKTGFNTNAFTYSE